MRTGSTKAALSSLILVVPLLFELKGWWPLWPEIHLVLIGVMAVAQFALVYNDTQRQPRLNIEGLIELMTKSLIRPEDLHHFRANVAIYNARSKTLRVGYTFNMMGHVDRRLELSVDQGCAGKSFLTRLPVWADLTLVKHEEYLVNAARVWKLMRSVLSVPIMRKNKTDSIGVLSVDSDLTMTESELNSETIIYAVNAYADVIGTLLES
jgi:hypothetical protein